MSTINEQITAAILDFDWGNYRLDDVAKLDPEYATDLADEIATAIGQGDRAVTRTPSDIWQAVMVDAHGVVCGDADIDEFEAIKVAVVRGSAAPVDGKLPYRRLDEDDVAHMHVEWTRAAVLLRYAQAQAMAAGLNAAGVTV